MSIPITLGDGASLGLGMAFGIELEYMIVDRATLAVRPIADKLLAAFADGSPVDVDRGATAWSNELALHVIELKTNGPTPSLAGWAAAFTRDIRVINDELAEHGAMLLPGAMHPTMDPAHETELWPHEHSEIYRTYDRIFICRRHGWANLQSCHVNLPFSGDDEFERLHGAIRALLPIMPALAASSPIMEGRITGSLDSRLDVYLHHQDRMPEATGDVIPEVYRSQDEYEEKVFQPLRRAAAALDPSGILRPEFLNARAAIARFERGAIEIRVLDVQETPRMDLAIAMLVSATASALAEERWAPISSLHAIPTESLTRLFKSVIQGGETVEISDRNLLRVFGCRGPIVVSDLWARLAAELNDGSPAWRELAPSLGLILREGPLARRLIASCGRSPDAELIETLWRRLGRNLTSGDAYMT